VKTLYTLFIHFLVITSAALSQGVGISETGAAPHNSAILDVSSTKKGFLPPRMTNAQRDSILNPPDGLVIFNHNAGCLNYFFKGSWYEWRGLVPYPTGTIHCSDTATVVLDVLNPTTGKTWMDRNLGARRAATGITDTDAYGDLYQWGRRADGHQCRNSLTTNVLSFTERPEHGFFIKPSGTPFNWLVSQNPDLWQGTNGVNNPCPQGYRVPAAVEIEEEFQSWSSPGLTGGFASPLKWVSGGIRSLDGSLAVLGSSGVYWTSSVAVSNNSTLVLAGLNTATLNVLNRAYGFSVRCLKKQN
jgi:hypothetical protein